MPDTPHDAPVGMSHSEAGRVVEPCPLARRARLRIVLRGPDFEARVGLRYRLEVAGETHRGKVDSGCCIAGMRGGWPSRARAGASASCPRRRGDVGCPPHRV